METGNSRKAALDALARGLFALFALSANFALPANVAHAQRLIPTYFPEQRTIQVRDPSELPRYSLPELPPPPTVTNRVQELEPKYITLDEAIQTALVNARVVRVLAGTSAIASGSTIYDAAITNTTIDNANARFDPTVTVNQSFNRLETPRAGFTDPLDPTSLPVIRGTQNQNYDLDTTLSKQNAYGGTAALNVRASPTSTQPSAGLPLNPQSASSASLSYTQPILKGGRLGPNLAPVVLARIDTERSYFQFKDSAQEQVRGVIEAYWNLVFARTDVWARRRQVDALREQVKRTTARVLKAIDNRADLAQTETALANAQGQLVSAEANMLQREAALRNILGIPPSDSTVLVPVTPPIRDQFVADWRTIVELAAERRPDLIELKLILEADGQFLQQARNTALPQLDAVALYRWNGLEGEMPSGARLTSGPGQFTDWSLGVNFSVPIGLRAGRAGLRQRELIIARDRANLEQGLHATAHTLATNVRAIDQTYEQYLAFKKARVAARINLEAQVARYESQFENVVLLNVLQAIADWGNTISAEANALTAYNTQLATLERETGTILETHGVVLYEERYGSIGPLGRFASDVCYPESIRESMNESRYGASDEPAEESFNLQLPRGYGDKVRRLPPATEDVPTPPPAPPRETSKKKSGSAPVRSASARRSVDIPAQSAPVITPPATIRQHHRLPSVEIEEVQAAPAGPPGRATLRG